MKYLLLLLCFQAIYLKECDDKSKKYMCSEQKLQDDKCMIYREKDKIFSLRNCPIDQVCETVVEEQKADGKDEMGYCINRLRKKYGKEKCGISAECYSNSCVDGYCVPFENNKVCERDAECSSQSYCAEKEKLCVPLILPGNECKKDNQCTAGYACGSNQADGLNAVCTKMFSLLIGQPSSNHLLCESGFAHKYTDQVYLPFGDVPKNAICSTSKLSSTEENCSGSSCKYEINGGGTFITTGAVGECKCTADRSKSYCTIATESDIWQNYLSEYKYTVDGITLSESQNTIYYRANGWGRPKLMQAIANIKNYPEFKSADECAIRYISSSGILESSLALILAIMTLLI